MFHGTNNFLFRIVFFTSLGFLIGSITTPAQVNARISVKQLAIIQAGQQGNSQCTLVVPQRVVISRPLQIFPLRLDKDCLIPARGALWYGSAAPGPGEWADHPMVYLQEIAKFASHARVHDWELHDDQPTGRWWWEEEKHSVGSQLFELPVDTPITEVRFGTTAVLTINRSRIRLTASYYHPQYDRYVPWSKARGTLEVRTTPHSPWKKLVDFQTDVQGKYISRSVQDQPNSREFRIRMRGDDQLADAVSNPIKPN